MTVAKVFCAMKNIPLYTVGTLQLYAGNETCRVLTDARGRRAYTNIYEEGRALEEDAVLENEAIREAYHGEKIIGDGHLIGHSDCWPDIVQNFLALKDCWKKADNVHLVVPEYLKPSEAYLIQK
jgi:tRNA threonylcarbamoyladenosine biosynthesis protein TsaB